MSKIKTLKTLQIIYIICIVSYIILIVTIKLQLINDVEGTGLLWGMTFGTLFTAALILYIIYALIKIKELGKIDWTFLIFSLLLVLFWTGSFFIGLRSAFSQGNEIGKLKTNQSQLQGALYGSAFKLPVNYFPLKLLLPMMKKDTSIQIDTHISGENFLSPLQAGKEVSMELMSFNLLVSGDEVLKEIDSLSYRPANISEFLAFIWNNYKSLKNIQVTSQIPSINLIDNHLRIPVFHWIGDVPTIILRNVSEVQANNEYSLVVKK